MGVGIESVGIRSADIPFETAVKGFVLAKSNLLIFYILEKIEVFFHLLKYFMRYINDN